MVFMETEEPTNQPQATSSRLHRTQSEDQVPGALERISKDLFH